MAENETKNKSLLLLSSSPHIASPVRAGRLMANMLIALAPAAIFGIVIFGLPALLTVLVSVAAAVLGEAGFRLATRQDLRAADLSAGVTGLLLALIIPPSTPLWMTALGAIFAVVVAKEFFGGLGANVFNPALSGRAFMLMSFPAAITTWHRPPGGVFSLSLAPHLNAASIVDGISGVTPLNIAKLLAGEGRLGEAVGAVGKDLLESGSSASSGYWSTMKTLFIGNHAGSIGESSILLILAGCVYLLATRTIDWRIPVSMIGTGILASFALGYDPLFGILSGGLVFGAVFMATDYVTSPLTSKGKLLFGFGAGLITILIRKWGSYPEGVTYGILIMNAFTPFMNRLLPRKYGYAPKKKPGTEPAGPKGAAK
ncbi:MAG: RnfABCDGE type electron transport complex subunit D [Treponema sp.]|jgi:electron transport complex protein RnfD|nr:RnfABCDGE type electron transport complex subunit D [Treponema sp.]